MATNLDLDETLIEEAVRLGGHRTKRKWTADFFFRSAGLKKWIDEFFVPIQGPERRAYLDRRPVSGRRDDFFRGKSPKDSISRNRLPILVVWG